MIRSCAARRLEPANLYAGTKATNSANGRSGSARDGATGWTAPYASMTADELQPEPGRAGTRYRRGSDRPPPLTVLDPAAAGLLACRRRAGLLLGCAVLLSDAAGNGYANYAVRPGQGITAGRAGQAVVTVLAIALLAVAPRVWPWLRPGNRAAQR